MSPLMIHAVRRAAGLGLLLALLAAPAGAAVPPPDRTTPPPPAASRPLRLPNVQVQTLPNGLRLAVVEMHRVPVADVLLLVSAGSARDPQDLPGLATFTANMLDEGAGSRDALALAEAVDYLGATLGTSSGTETATVWLHATKAKLPQALDLMADVVLRPAFADSEVTRQRELRRNALLQLRDQPTQIAPVAFNAILYGPQHPYGRPQAGDDASTALLDRTRIVDFYRTYYRPGNAKLLVVGDVTPAEARRLVEARFGAWVAGDVPAAPVADPPPPGPRTFYLVDKPGSAQSVIRLGNVGAARSTPDYHALQVMNTILGGAYTSRLNQNLRQAHGYTYGAGSTFDLMRLAGPFRASASVQTAKTDSAVIEFLRELRRMREEPVPEAELAKARAYLTLGLPAQFETTRGAAQMFFELLADDLPLDTYDHLVERLNAVTAADVQRVARQYVRPDEFTVVVVGDRAQVEAPLRALGEGPLELRDLWGRPTK